MVFLFVMRLYKERLFPNLSLYRPTEEYLHQHMIVMADNHMLSDRAIYVWSVSSIQRG